MVLDGGHVVLQVEAFAKGRGIDRRGWRAPDHGGEEAFAVRKGETQRFQAGVGQAGELIGCYILGLKRRGPDGRFGH